MTTTRQQRQQIQARISPADVEFLARLHPQQSEALRRAIELARQTIDASKTDQPARQLAYYLARASELAAQVAAAEAQRHPAPPILAGSTATPTHDAPLYKEGAHVEPATAAELTGFEGWDE